METSAIIEIIKATAGSLDSIISQLAWFFAIKAAAGWLSFTLPCLLLFGVLHKVAKSYNATSQHEKAGAFILIAWIVFCGALYTGTKGIAHVAQAAVSPSVYVALEAGDLLNVLKGLKK